MSMHYLPCFQETRRRKPGRAWAVRENTAKRAGFNGGPGPTPSHVGSVRSHLIRKNSFISTNRSAVVTMGEKMACWESKSYLWGSQPTPRINGCLRMNIGIRGRRSAARRRKGIGRAAGIMFIMFAMYVQSIFLMPARSETIRGSASLSKYLPYHNKKPKT